jgi:hypothetical protein
MDFTPGDRKIYRVKRLHTRERLADALHAQINLILGH